jgi:3-dehydroquinate synthase
MNALHRVAVQPAEVESGRYEILLGSGIWSSLPTILERHAPAHRYAVIADDRVAELMAVRLARTLHAAGHRTDVFVFPAGEANKTRETWASVSDAMLEAGIGRDSAVVALGGGVVGDLAGFIAATYMRGLPTVLVPTTLLAMIDASVGGKTGVDTLTGKNLIGAFHPPRAVVVDPDLLATLPPEHLRTGLAEAIKHGAIADEAYLEWIAGAADRLLAGEAAALRHLILRSLEIKAEIVARDVREIGPRKALNFGHTVGHALEAASAYDLLHGEAVAIGMVAEARAGEHAGITAAGTSDRLRRLLGSVGLPTGLPMTLAPEEVLARIGSDKKVRHGRPEYALPARVGEIAVRDGRFAQPLADEVVLGALGQ